jgi:hypothetical protein
VMDTLTADKTHRGHAIIEQVHADLKSSALAHLPSGVFTANAAWLVLAVIAFNLTPAAASITGPALAKATTATIRRKLIIVPARIASSARRLRLPGTPAAPRERTTADHGQQVDTPKPIGGSRLSPDPPIARDLPGEVGGSIVTVDGV